MLFAKNLTLSRQRSLALGVSLCALLSSVGCSRSLNSEADAKGSGETGTLTIVANGESFAQEGLLSKDQWQLNFDHVFVTLEDVAASETSFIKTPNQQPPILIAEAKTVDLATSDSSVATLEVPAKHYRGLQWKLVPSSEGDSKGNALLLQGQANKADQTIQFSIGFDSDILFACGDYVGETRKGVVSANDTAELEATFHLDHLFGNGDAPAEDSINQKSLGFNAFASLATNGSLDISMDDLKSQLPPQEFGQLTQQLIGLGHVGEGHCEGQVT